MTRCRNWIVVAAVLITVAALLTAAVPQKADAASLRVRLTQARRALRDARQRLRTAEAELAAAVAASASTPTPSPTATPSPDPTPDPSVSSAPSSTPSPSATPSPAATTTSATATASIEELQARVVEGEKMVKRWTRLVRRLAKRYRLQRRLAAWERRGNWRPIIKIAAARYHVKADGVYRMMMRESGGRRFAGTGSAFKGLFQYSSGTWAASWNPWRSDSIYDGSSQINATCYAIHRGYGPRMWTTTFTSQY